MQVSPGPVSIITQKTGYALTKLPFVFTETLHSRAATCFLKHAENVRSSEVTLLHIANAYLQIVTTLLHFANAVMKIPGAFLHIANRLQQIVATLLQSAKCALQLVARLLQIIEDVLASCGATPFSRGFTPG